jgi:hypothetical protein
MKHLFFSIGAFLIFSGVTSCRHHPAYRMSPSFAYGENSGYPGWVVGHQGRSASVGYLK